MLDEKPSSLAFVYTLFTKFSDIVPYLPTIPFFIHFLYRREHLLGETVEFSLSGLSTCWQLVPLQECQVAC